MTVIVTVPPAIEPVSLEEMKAHLNLTHDDDDALVAAKVKAARAILERFLGMAFINTTMKAVLDGFPSWLVELPRRPVQSVTGITYRDRSFESQTIEGASLRAAPLGSEAPTFVGLIDAPWPQTAEFPGSVEVTFVAGFGASADHVPDAIREAIRLYAAHLYENRESTYIGTGVPYELPMGVNELLLPWRGWSFG